MWLVGDGWLWRVVFSLGICGGAPSRSSGARQREREGTEPVKVRRHFGVVSPSAKSRSALSASTLSTRSRRSASAKLRSGRRLTYLVLVVAWCLMQQSSYAYHSVHVLQGHLFLPPSGRGTTLCRVTGGCQYIIWGGLLGTKSTRVASLSWSASATSCFP